MDNLERNKVFVFGQKTKLNMLHGQEYTILHEDFDKACSTTQTPRPTDSEWRTVCERAENDDSEYLNLDELIDAMIKELQHIRRRENRR